MKVLFLSPHFPLEMQEFTLRLKQVGAEVYGLADVPEAQLPENIRKCLSGYVQVNDNYKDQEQVVAAGVDFCRKHGIDKIETLWEVLQLMVGKMRDRLGMGGMGEDAILGFRDKDMMKQRVRAAGLRVAKSRRVKSAADIYAACEEFGYPVVVKPLASAGSLDTYKLASKAEVDAVLPKISHLDEGNVEEFITGEEFTFDAVTIDGVPVFYSVNQYFPVMLESRTYEWISPADITYKDPDIPKLAGGVQLAKDVLKALGMGTGFVHMEWFLTPKGEAVFGEIAARNGGGHIVDLINYANDFDIYKEWANVIVHGKWTGQPSRKYFVSMVCKRAEGTGKITRIEGLEKVRARLGKALMVEKILPVGSPREDWKKSFVSDGMVIFRHPDMAELQAMRDCVVHDLKMYAAP